MTNHEIVQHLKAIFDVPQELLLGDKTTARRPERLYHFTDCVGLIGILSAKKLWASLATTLNDPSEMTYAIERARHLLKSGGIAAEPRFLTATELALDLNYTRRAIKIVWRVYVVSFCGEPDSALHWFHYGRSGTGVAVGFRSNNLEVPGFDLFPVIYDHKEQDALLRRLLEKAWQHTAAALTQLPTQHHDAVILGAGELAANNVWLVAPRLKAPVFSPEHEWRLLTYEPKGLQMPPGTGVVMDTLFRSASGRVIPYKRIDYSPLPVTDIVLGASAAMDPADDALDILLTEGLGAAVPVSRSSVPIRP
jgi:hypothetical protein